MIEYPLEVAQAIGEERRALRAALELWQAIDVPHPSTCGLDACWVCAAQTATAEALALRQEDERG